MTPLEYYNSRSDLERHYTPTRVGYDCAAFVRYRVPCGGDQSRSIETMPSDQWGLQSDEAAAYRSYNAITYRQYHSWLSGRLVNG